MLGPIYPMAILCSVISPSCLEEFGHQFGASRVVFQTALEAGMLHPRPAKMGRARAAPQHDAPPPHLPPKHSHEPRPVACPPRIRKRWTRWWVFGIVQRAFNTRKRRRRDTPRVRLMWSSRRVPSARPPKRPTLMEGAPRPPHHLIKMLVRQLLTAASILKSGNIFLKFSKDGPPHDRHAPPARDSARHSTQIRDRRRNPTRMPTCLPHTLGCARVCRPCRFEKV